MMVSIMEEFWQEEKQKAGERVIYQQNGLISR
jgi:hypothetical protein